MEIKINDTLSPEKIYTLKVISMFCTVAGFIWAGFYAFFEIYGLSVYLPISFSILMGVSLILYQTFKQEKLLIYSLLTLILIIPTLLQWYLGGFHKSGIVIFWSILAPFAAIIFLSLKKSINWIIAFEILLFISIYFDNDFKSYQKFEIKEKIILIFYSMNIIAVTTIIFVCVYYYNSILEKESSNREKYFTELNFEVDQLLFSIQKLSIGDLTVKIKSETKEPIFLKLNHGYNQGLELIKSLVKDLQDSSDNTVQSIKNSSNLLTGIENNIQNFLIKCNNMETSILNFKKFIAELDKYVMESKEFSNDSITKAGSGEKNLTITVSKILDVNESFKESVEMIKQLETISSEISEITNSINEISESTNLLSLNASIEAARAGENGKGFSVVAKEIGKLTTLTTDATKKIEKKVKEIQQKTKQASTQFSGSYSLVNDSVDNITKLKTTIESVINSIKKSDSNNSTISVSLNKESKDIQNVSNEILEIVNSFKKISEEVHNLFSNSTHINNNTDQMITKLKMFTIK